MTTRIELRGVSVIGPNPTAFDDPIQLRVTLEVFEKPPACPIDVKFTWKPIWDFPVDQELDELEVGPLDTLGKHELTLQCDPPDYSKIPDPTGPTALVISFLYKGKEFLHLGYNALVVCEGDIPDVFTDAKQLRRNLTRCFPKQSIIRWDNEESVGSTSNESVDADENRFSEEDAGNVQINVGSKRDAGEESSPLKRART